MESVTTHTPASSQEQTQNIEFRDHSDSWLQSVRTQPDSTYNVASTPDVPLGKYLSRAVEIDHFSWTNNIATPDAFPGSSKAYIMDPWSLFFQNSEVTKKVDTYRYFRGNLKVKVLVNGNGFLFGQMAVFYHPLYAFDDFKDYGPETTYGQTSKKYVAFDDRQYVRHSQKPHMYLIPAISQGGTMELPFIWNRNYIDLTEQEVTQMGRLFFYPLNNLTTMSTTNAANSKCDVSILAWFEDYVLTTPTSAPFATPVIEQEEEIPISQSGGDEYGKQPFSKTAAAVSASMGSLSRVPIIGPYARASSMISGDIGSMARLFGFSRPTILTDVAPYKPVYLGNMANVDCGDSSNKLTFDSKQEVTIDPRVVGLSSSDEMTITHIASKECFLDSVPWAAANSSSSRLLQIAVTPQLFKKSALIGTGTQVAPIHLTASAYVSLPFLSWRGTMRYRFQIIASQFHRGRIRVVWDPKKITESAASVFTDFNHVYSKIIDLADCRDFTVDVGWGQATPYLPLTVDYKTAAETDVFKETGVSIIPQAGFNGQLGIYVLNPLISATDQYNTIATTSSVYINVFTSCPDLMVANPCEYSMQNYSFYATGTILNTTSESDDEDDVAISQAGFLEDSELQQNAPTATNTISFTLGPTVNSMSDEAHHIFYGDPILSVRALLKRYTFYAKYPNYPDATAGLDTSTSSRLRYMLPDYPLYQGEVKIGSEPYMMEIKGAAPPGGGSPATVRWNAVLTSFMTYYTPSFVCRRGGIRWKYTSTFVPISGFNNKTYLYTQPMVTLRVSRCPNYKRPQVIVNDTVSSKPSDIAYDGYNSLPGGSGGQFATQTSVQPTAEVELPFYNYHRFVPGFRKNPGETGAVKIGEDNNTFPYHQVVLECMRVDRTNGTSIEAFCAAADDYSLFFYIGPPVLYTIAYTKARATAVSADNIFPA